MVVKKNDIVGYGKTKIAAHPYLHYGLVTGLIAAGTHPPSHVLVLELTRECIRAEHAPDQYIWKFQKVIWPIGTLVVVDHINDLVLLEKIYE